MKREVYKALCIHWDHHPTLETPNYGAGTNAEEIRQYLREVKPDLVQYHTIGCKGYVNFPSKIAPVVPGLVGDPLKVWREVCTEEGIEFGCYAASFSAWYPQPVPQWRCINREGIISDKDYCPNGPWTEEFFIPLLLEIIDRYHPSHFWLDGVWLPPREDYCFCEYCQQKFYKQYKRQLPKHPTDTDWIELQEFYERSLDEAIARIGKAIKRHDPKILLSCNSAYFFKDLRPPIQEVDWLSWDVINTPDLYKTSFEANYLSNAGKPADIMIYENGIIKWVPQIIQRPRPIGQLKAEVSILMAHGLRVNLWHNPNPDGSIKSDKAEIAKQVAKFVRERQDWCIDNESVAEVALLASRLQHCIDFEHQNIAIRTASETLQEINIPYDIVREDTLLNRLNRYHLVILPEISILDINTAQKLYQFIVDGGKLLLVATELKDSKWLPIILAGDNIIQTPLTKEEVFWNGKGIQVNRHIFHLSNQWQCLIPYKSGVPWLAETSIGKGKVFIITSEIFSDYSEHHWPELRNLIDFVIRKKIGDMPFAEMVDRNPGIEVVVNRRGNDLYVHLVNLVPNICLGPSKLFFDDIIPHSNIKLRIRFSQRPATVLKLGEEDNFEILYSDNEINLTIPRLYHHTAICLKAALL